MRHKQKLEKVLELLINEQAEEATDLLHQVFVEKARAIHESLMAEEDVLEGGVDEDADPEELKDQVESEEYFGESDLLEDDDEDLKSYIESVEAELHDLEEKFETLMSDHEEDHEEDLDGDGEIGSVDMEGEEDESDDDDEEDDDDASDDDEDDDELKEENMFEDLDMLDEVEDDDDFMFEMDDEDLDEEVEEDDFEEDMMFEMDDDDADFMSEMEDDDDEALEEDEFFMDELNGLEEDEADDDDFMFEMDDDLDLDEEVEEDDFMFEDDLDDMKALDEDAMDFLNSVNDRNSHSLVGRGGKFQSNEKSPIPQKKAADRMKGAHASSSKGGEHRGYDLEKAPASKSVKKHANVVTKGTASLSKVSKDGNKKALLNKREGKENSVSPISGKGKK